MSAIVALFGAICACVTLFIMTLKIADATQYTKTSIVGPPRPFLAWATNSFPAFNSRWGEEGFNKYMRASNGATTQHTAQPFRVAASYGYSTVLPPELLQEYSRMGPDKIDFMAPPRDVSDLGLQLNEHKKTHNTAHVF